MTEPPTTENFPTLDELPLSERDEMVADVMQYLKDRGYTVLGPGKFDLIIEQREHDARAQALQDAGEIVFNGARRATPIQLAVKLKQMSDRVRAGAKR